MVKSWYPSKGDDSCVKVNLAGTPYEDFGCLYPTMGKTFFDWETKYDPVAVRDYMAANPWVPIVACIVYYIAIFAGQSWFEKRERWHWRTSLMFWNLGLSLFSFMGVVRTFPVLLHNWTHYGLEENFCFDPESSFGSGISGLWVQLFVLSKFPELLDTFFIVIHKKPLIFLHWYHHISVLLYCWHSYVFKAPIGSLFSVMNYAVHAIMYFYYFLMAARCKPKWFQAVWITVAQISQMFVGVMITVIAIYLKFVKKPDNCYLRMENTLAAMVMYGSYLTLFLQFFLGRYFKSSSKKSKVKKEV